VMQAVRNKLGKDARIALFLDNARIHISQVTQTAAKDVDINIKLLRNVSYRPDNCGVENYWWYCKKEYRRQVDFYKAQGWTWIQRNMV